MSKSVSVNEIQDASAYLRRWANGDQMFEDDPPADLLLAIADLVETLLYTSGQRAEDKPRIEKLELTIKELEARLALLTASDVGSLKQPSPMKAVPTIASGGVFLEP